MRIFLLKTCDTCRKALKALRDAGHDPEVVDIRADGIPQAEIARFHAEFGNRLVNRSARIWRDLDDAERAEDPVTLIGRHPTLMKRPVIDDGATLHLGWTEEARAALL
ncbi:arsenate reductase family protein [Palleronia aestuarii]|nr:ArsC/Spx/MgsR family protein [Palleronia aestuarii]